MKNITLYRYTRADGGTTISPNKPDGEYTELRRLIADEGKAITKDGKTFYTVVDVETQEGYYEVDYTFDETE